MEDRQIRRQALLDALNSRVVVLDGAMGTMLYERHLTLNDYGGPQFENCHENLVFTRPEVIRDIHRAYFAAGADMVETDTFGGTPLVLAEFGISHLAREQNITAVRLAREAADEFSTPGRPRFVAGSMGPTTKAITVSGGITFGELIETYAAQAEALIEGGADVLLLETSNDTRTVKAALLGINRAAKLAGYRVPVMVSGTVEPTGTMLAGQTADAFYTSISHADLLSVGLNCATGPEFM